MVKWAVSEELVPPAVLVGLQSIPDLKAGRSQARETGAVHPVSIDRVIAIENHISAPVWGMIQFQLLTGAGLERPGVVRGCDLNMAGEIWEYVPESHKNEHHGLPRVIMIGPEGQKLLRKFLVHEMAAYLFCAFRDHAEVTPMTARRTGTRSLVPASGHSICRWACDTLARRSPNWQKTREMPNECGSKAEAKAWRSEHCWSPHQLRHNYATEPRRQYGIEATRVVLGHASIGTSELYAERDLDKARRVAAAVG